MVSLAAHIAFSYHLLLNQGRLKKNTQHETTIDLIYEPVEGNHTSFYNQFAYLFANVGCHNLTTLMEYTTGLCQTMWAFPWKIGVSVG